MKKVLALVVVLGLLGLFGWHLYQRITAAQQRPGRRGTVAVAVQVAPVETGTIRDVGWFTGSLLPNSQFVVAPKVGGRLERLHVNIGSPVTRGMLIAELDNAEYVQQVEEARAELTVANATVLQTKSALDVATRELKRTTELRQKNIIPESEFEVVKAKHEASQALHKVALARVTQKEAALKAAEIRSSYTRIHATWQTDDRSDTPDRPRVVGERFVDEGAMLKANEPIVSVLDISAVIAVVHVIEQDYARVRRQAAIVTPTEAFPGRRFTGKVVRVAPLLKETSRQARVEVLIPNPDHLLKGGMFVRVELQFAERDESTVVPVAALSRREGKQVVFLADLAAKKARLVPVTLGIVNGERAEVLSPPLRGHVVTLGQHLLSDGAAISLPADASTSRPATRSGAGRRQRGDRPARPGGRP